MATKFSMGLALMLYDRLGREITESDRLVDVITGVTYIIIGFSCGTHIVSWKHRGEFRLRAYRQLSRIDALTARMEVVGRVQHPLLQ